jgi:hypothetical protein
MKKSSKLSNIDKLSKRLDSIMFGLKNCIQDKAKMTRQIKRFDQAKKEYLDAVRKYNRELSR